MNRKVFLLVMAGLLSSRGVLAGEATSNFTGQEMVVTATKTENKRKDVPNAVIVIDRKELEASAAGNLGELIANRTGIDLGSYGNYGGSAKEIHIRGMNADGTQVFVNGIRVNSISLGTADVAKIPLANIEKIEIVKGSGSLLYGSGASGGVINIFTREPGRDRMNLELATEYGTQGTYGISLTQGMALDDNLSYLLTAGRNGTDGFRDNSDLEGKTASLKLNYRKSDKLNVSLFGDFMERKYGMPGVVPPAGTVTYIKKGTAYYNDEAASLLNRHEDKEWHAGLRVSGKPSEKLHYSFQTDYSYSGSYNYNRDTSGFYSSRTWVTNQVEGFEGNLTFKPFDGGEILFGGEYRQYDYENRVAPMDSNFNPEFDDRYNLHSGALYTELQYRPSRYLKFLSGVRIEDNSLFGTKYVYRYGAVINPAEKTAIKFNSGSHFKAPTMNDLFWPDDGYTKGNPLLTPETGWHTDVTLEQELPGKVFLTAGYFHWNIKNKIAWAEDPSQPAAYGFYWVPTNLDSYKADGMELGAKAVLSGHLSLSLDYTLLYSVEEKAGSAERQSMYTPRHQFKSQLVYTDNHGLTVSPTVTFMGRRPYYTGSNTGSVPSRYIASNWLLDLKMSKRIADHFIVSASVNNLFDKYYVTRLENFYDAYYNSALCPYPGSGRSFLLSLTYRY
jgi:outer membrane cobalamin receptor